ncbi:MAG: hypothetical protein RI893_665 [Pseudomonadota bacterium]|jgi:Fis family transcriptional regulator
MNPSQKGAEIINIDSKKKSAIPLCVHVKQTVEQYFLQLNGDDPVDLYALVIGEVEKPLLQVTLEHFGYNQSKAAKVLGLSRSTLRKKMEFYRLS